MIYLNMPVGELYGWAVCGKYLLRELDKRGEVGYIEGYFNNQLRNNEEELLVEKTRVVDCINFGTIIHTLTPQMKSSCKSWGNKNIGYMFHESDRLSKEQIENLRKFDVVVAGSEWNARVVRNHGIDCYAIQQGVDQDIFKYKKRKQSDRFVVFSGGKWETRKGQRLVIDAFKIFSKRFDSVLIASWGNLFNEHAEQEIREVTHGIKGVCQIGMQSHQNLRGFIYETDIGVFPNTSEGGTNLVLMEYLSCGRPSIANISTGQADVVHPAYSYCINGNNLVRDIVDNLEYAVNHRDELDSRGKVAHMAMSSFSWGRMADRFLSL